MLILKRIEIQGFKSFCDRTEMRFSGSGVAAVVGPNGCGKSNLSDAISWVLGEQSAKSLRGSRMEDVIFAGTRDRKPLGLAVVTMTLVDPEGKTVIPGQRIEAPKAGNLAPSNPSSGQSIEVAVAATTAIVAEQPAAVEFPPDTLKIEHLDAGGHSTGNGHANGNGHSNGSAIAPAPGQAPPRPFFAASRRSPSRAASSAPAKAST